ncbi:hypothetical protein QYE76_014242 [Lolium multiflorum]|uniref:Uncharacterized protein n=1 Tax=Lolium multiflorum TaxID=4521 RepID=A0AAD8U4K1_LOLMU|nr:hypothetical protein QYE76_014242 [Lolium multiflorum]
MMRDLEIEDTRFWCTEQLFIYKDIYQKMDKVRPMHPLDLDTLAEKDHFTDVVWVTEKMGLHKLMQLKRDYSVPLIQQFYSTLAFKKDEEHTMMWMTGSTPCEANFHRFAELHGNPFRVGHRLHGPNRPDKDLLYDLYTEHGEVGTTTGLLPLRWSWRRHACAGAPPRIRACTARSPAASSSFPTATFGAEGAAATMARATGSGGGEGRR